MSVRGMQRDKENGKTVSRSQTPAPQHSLPLALQLQRTIGNRAVSRLVEGSAARRIRPSSAEVFVQRIFGRNMRARIKANEYPNLQPILEKAKAGEASRGELEKALRKVDKYKEAAAKMKGIDVAERLETLSAYGDEFGFALDRLNVKASKEMAKEVYLGQARSGGLKALSASSAPSFGEGRQPLVAQEAGLHQAESAALSAYAGNDYEYINPALAHNKQWMQAQARNRALKGSEKERFEEGSLLAAMMMEGMGKLPVWKGAGYRGERLSPAEFAEQYADENGAVTAKKPTQVTTRFWSVSMDRSVAQGFANSSGAEDDRTISMLYIIEVGNARDLRDYSSSDEDEVLCPVGSKVSVTKIEKLERGPAGMPTATAWYEVHMTQT